MADLPMMIVCSFLMATGQPECSEPMTMGAAISLAIANNKVLPYKPGAAHSPSTIFFADDPPEFVVPESK